MSVDDNFDQDPLSPEETLREIVVRSDLLRDTLERLYINSASPDYPVILLIAEMLRMTARLTDASQRALNDAVSRSLREWSEAAEKETKLILARAREAEGEMRQMKMTLTGKARDQEVLVQKAVASMYEELLARLAKPMTVRLQAYNAGEWLKVTTRGGLTLVAVVATALLVGRWTKTGASDVELAVARCHARPVIDQTTHRAYCPLEDLTRNWKGMAELQTGK